MARSTGDPPAPSSFAGVLHQIREDYTANGSSHSRPGFRAMAVQRLGAYARTLEDPRLRRVAERVCRTAHRLVRNHYGIEVHATTRIGARCFIAHQGAIVIHEWATVGNDCKIRQGVTIGQLSGNLDREGAPTIGDRVEIGAGAVILGPVSIGDDAMIGPNAVVVRDVPPGASAMGPPAKIVSRPAGEP
ncbi:MAG: DapH/DapD/GlmU-related protein [Acidimicrobiales bacterium]|nr:DapH/DapD/GlmU-related protein [Acidimicrobiales bacterium]